MPGAAEGTKVTKVSDEPEGVPAWHVTDLTKRYKGRPATVKGIEAPSRILPKKCHEGTSQKGSNLYRRI